MRFLHIFLILVLINSCSGRENKIKRRDIIPEKELIQVLEDIHLADALLTSPVMLNQYPGKDSTSNYQDILNNHGYSLDDFDKTLLYYSDKPEKLEVIYEQLIDKLSLLESEINNKKYFDKEGEADKPELWKMKNEWHMPHDGKQEKIAFDIPIDKQGKYILRAQIKMYKDDGSSKPAVTAYFWYDDGTKEGKKYSFSRNNIVKNGQWRSFALIHTTQDTLITHIRGFLVDHNEQKSSDWENHFDIRGVSLKLLEEKK